MLLSVSNPVLNPKRAAASLEAATYLVARSPRRRKSGMGGIEQSWEQDYYDYDDE